MATEQAPASSSPFDRANAFVQTRALPLALGAMVLASILVRFWLSRSIKTPWILSDEFTYSELAKSFAHHGHFLVRGVPSGVVSYLYPVLIAPAWLAGSMHTTYLLAKAINAVLMSLVAIPVYLWGSRIAPRRYALVAAALTLLLPSFFYTGELMTENGFFPVFILAAFAIALVLERPTLWRQALMLFAFGLTIAVRFQGVVVLAVLPTALVLKLIFDLLGRGDEPPRRIIRKNLVPLWPAAAVLLGASAGYVAYKQAQGVSLRSGLGAYQGVTQGGYSLGPAARWVLYHFAELPLAAGYIPACAFLLLLGLALARPRTLSNADRSFVAVAAATTVWLVVEVATFASKNSLRVEERYMFPAAALFLLALAAWLGRGAPRPLLTTLVAATVPAALLLTLPLTRLLNVSITSDTFSLIPLYRLSTVLSGGVPLVKQLLVAGGVAGSLLFALVPRRFAAPAIVGAVGAFLVLSSYSVHGTIRDYSRNLAAGTGVLGDPTWIDDAAGDRDVDVDVLYGNSTDAFQEAVALWESEFWNEDVGRVYTFGVTEPGTFPETLVKLDPANGRLSATPYSGASAAQDLARTRYLVASGGLDFLGRRRGRRGPFALYAVVPPPRIASSVSGLYSDGWSGADASYSRFRVTRSGSVIVTVSRASWGGLDVPAHVTIAVSPSAARPSVRHLVIHSRQTLRATVGTPGRPFVVRVHVSPTFSPSRFGLPDTRQLGARFSFRFSPRP